MGAGGPLALIGSGLNFFGGVASGAATKQAGDYNAAVASNNALESAEEGTVAGQQVARQGTLAIGKAAAAYGASGVSGDSGSALTSLMQDAGQAALDENLTEHKYDMQAYGYSTTAALDIYEGNTGQESADIGALGSLFTGAGTAIGNQSPGSSSNSSGGNGLNGMQVDSSGDAAAGMA